MSELNQIEDKGVYRDYSTDEFLYRLDQSRRASVFDESFNPEDNNVLIPFHQKTSEEKDKLLEEIRGLILFKDLDLEQIQSVVNAMVEVKVKKGDFVYKQGDECNTFYVIQHGRFELFGEEYGSKKVLEEYENYGHFGEIALMYNKPSTCTVHALSDGSLWKVDRFIFRKIVATGAWKRRKFYEGIISSIPMLKCLDASEKDKLFDALETRQYKNDEIIFKSGDTADGMFFIEFGSVAVLEGDENRTIKKKLLSEGYFEEQSLINETIRKVTCVASGEVRLAFLRTESFERLLGPCKEIMKRNQGNCDPKKILLNET